MDQGGGGGGGGGGGMDARIARVVGDEKLASLARQVGRKGWRRQ